MFEVLNKEHLNKVGLVDFALAQGPYNDYNVYINRT